jgi:hypothetical protein
MEGIYEMCTKMGSGGKIYKFNEDWYRHSCNFKALHQQFERLYVAVSDGRDL